MRFSRSYTLYYLIVFHSLSFLNNWIFDWADALTLTLRSKITKTSDESKIHHSSTLISCILSGNEIKLMHVMYYTVCRYQVYIYIYRNENGIPMKSVVQKRRTQLLYHKNQFVVSFSVFNIFPTFFFVHRRLSLPFSFLTKTFSTWQRQQHWIVFQQHTQTYFQFTDIVYCRLLFRIQSEWKIKLFCYCLMARLILCRCSIVWFSIWRRVWSFHSFFNKNEIDKFKSLVGISCNAMLFTNVLNKFPSKRKSTHPLAIVLWLGCK